MPTPSILTRYIFKEVLGYFLISLFAFISILLTLRLLKFTSLIVNKGVSIVDIATIFTAIIPTFLEFALPMAAILGVMLAFARLSGDSEIIVLRASGISIYQLVKPVFAFGCIISILTYFVATEFKPWGFKVLEQALFRIAQTKTTSGLEPGVFNPLGNMTLYTERIDYATGELYNVLIDDRRGSGGEDSNTQSQNSRRIIIATTGLVKPNPAQRRIEFYLRDGSIHEIQKDPKQNEHYVITRFITQNISMSSDEINQNSEQNERAVPPREMVNAELAKYLENSVYAGLTRHEAVKRAAGIDKSTYKRDFGRYSAEWVRRFSLPFACLIMALIGLPFGIQNPRTQKTWGIGLSAFLALSAFMLYFAFFSFGVTYAENGRVNPWLGLWTPNIVLILLVIFLIHKVASEQWSTGIDPIERLLSRVKK